VAVSVPFTEFGAATGKAYTINANTPTSHADRPPFVTSFAVRVATITIRSRTTLASSWAAVLCPT
jgi:hypothetical protein